MLGKFLHDLLLVLIEKFLITSLMVAIFLFLSSNIIIFYSFKKKGSMKYVQQDNEYDYNMNNSKNNSFNDNDDL